MQHRVTVAEIGVERGQRGELAPDGVVGQLLLHEVLAPGDDVDARHVAELGGLPQACEGHEVIEVLLVRPARVGIGQVRKPFDLRGDVGQSLELSGREHLG